MPCHTVHTATHASRDNMRSSFSLIFFCLVLVALSVHLLCCRLCVCIEFVCISPPSPCVCGATTWHRNTGTRHAEENYINATAVPGPLAFTQR